MAKECADQRGLPVRVKQLYLLAALEYDRFQKQALGITDQVRGPFVSGLLSEYFFFNTVFLSHL